MNQTHSYCVFSDKTEVEFWDIKKSKKCKALWYGGLNRALKPQFRQKYCLLIDLFLMMTGTVCRFALVYLSCSF